MVGKKKIRNVLTKLSSPQNAQILPKILMNTEDAFFTGDIFINVEIVIKMVLLYGCNFPVDRLLILTNKNFIGFGEMFTTKETLVCCKRRWVCCF